MKSKRVPPGGAPRTSAGPFFVAPFCERDTPGANGARGATGAGRATGAHGAVKVPSC
jgi:hypothetical protein